MGGGISRTLSTDDAKEEEVRAGYLAGEVDIQLGSSSADDADKTVFSDWVKSHVEISTGKITITHLTTKEPKLVVDLHGRPEVVVSKLDSKHTMITVRSNCSAFNLKSSDEKDMKHWLRVLREEIIFCNSANYSESGFKSVLDQFKAVFETDDDFSTILEQSERPALQADTASSPIQPPKLNIVILVVGTRGDVQPFVYLGQALQAYGHRVRLATHAEYRDDVVAKGGLEYYPLAGDPRKLSEYMVKTGGRLMPDLLNEEERSNLPEKMKMLKEITFSCFPACTAPDPDDVDEREFLADAIISNPVSYGHIHCAEALCIPLVRLSPSLCVLCVALSVNVCLCVQHIMFPQPWSPTKCFPHPLSNMGFDTQWSNQNYYSYLLVDEFMWLGLGSIVNNFRKQVSLD